MVWKFFGVDLAAPPAAVEAAARAHCLQPWQGVWSHLGHHINVEKYCMWGPYVAQLLTKGLKLDPEQFDIGKNALVR